ncbi:MAG: 2Fe-2S iron-sulfur cluster-binding protein [Atribacterota bacterium]|nr:2Fe-2S iron-sulfur cluster-binding protein [Atribacterota bacterium]
MSESKKEINVLVYRSHDGEENSTKTGEYEKYKIPFEERMTVMDVLSYINENFGRDLSYYYSCRIGKCNGCLVSVNGKNKLACVTLAKEGLEIGPARNYKVIKDLFVDFSKKS